GGRDLNTAVTYAKNIRGSSVGIDVANKQANSLSGNNSNISEAFLKLGNSSNSIINNNNNTNNKNNNNSSISNNNNNNNVIKVNSISKPNSLLLSNNINSSNIINISNNSSNSNSSSSSNSNNNSSNNITVVRPTIVTHTAKPTIVGGKFTALPTTITTKVALADKGPNNMPKKLTAAAGAAAASGANNTRIGASGAGSGLSAASAYLNSGAGNYLNSLSTNDLMSLAAYVASKGSSVNSNNNLINNNNLNNNNGTNSFFANSGGASTSAASAANFNMAASLLAQSKSCNKSSSQEFPTPMSSSSSIRSTNDYISDQVDSQVEEQVSNAIRRFYHSHGQSLKKLESLLMNQVVPRMDKSRADHGRVMKRMMRRLNDLRPTMVNYKTCLEDGESPCHSLPDEPDAGMKRFRKKQDKLFARQSIDLRSCFSSLIKCRKPKPAFEDSVTEIVTEPQSISQLTGTKSRGHLQPKVDLTQPQLAKPEKNIKFLYKNLGFGSSLGKAYRDPEYALRKVEYRHFGPLPEKCSAESDSKRKELCRRLLEVNLLFHKSSCSLHMNRFKYPPRYSLPKAWLFKSSLLTHFPLRWQYS
ncbi:hypothetical protein AWZ03_012554, partial [Drosophila navojoa]